MKIADKLAQSGHSFSFEFFPPKDDKSAEALLRAVERLRSLEPAYVSVTWGAGGSTHRKTLDVVQMAKSRFGLESMAHLTCVGASKANIDAVLDDIDARGIENVLALRGDPPQGDASFTPHPDGLAHADELVARIRARWGFSIGVAGYPEGHIESPSLEADLDHLKRKIDAGADFIVTQLFFDNDAFFRFVERVRAAGIEAPVLPGIMPITNVSQIKRFTDLCGASIPQRLLDRIEPIAGDREAVIAAGIDYSTQQCRELLEQGAKGVHFYTLNLSRSTKTILENLRAAGIARTV